MFYITTLLILWLSFVLITLLVTLTFTCCVEFYYLDNHFTTIIPSVHNHDARHLAQNATTLLQPYKVVRSKVATTYKFSYGLLGKEFCLISNVNYTILTK